MEIPWTAVWFFWQLHKLLKCFRGKKEKHMENCFPMFPKKVITALHCWTCKNVSLPHPVWVSEWDFTATAVKKRRKREGKGRRGSGEALPVCSAKDLSCSREEPCQQMPNQCSTCQTAPYPSQSAKKNYPLPDFSYLTNKGLGFFPLLGQSPLCKIPALISAFNNMCCTSAQKESN